MSEDLRNFMETSVALHELREGVVGRLFQFMRRVEIYEVDRQESKLAWDVLYYYHYYCKKDLRKAFSTQHAYDVVKARLTADKQKYL